MSLHVETRGSGPPLVLLHGWGLHGGIWKDVSTSLAATHTLHIVDLPGHGHSRDVAMQSLDQMADAVAASVPGDAAIVGWSLGGQVALRLASRRRARKLVLVATTPCFVQRDDWPHAMRGAVLQDFADRLQSDYRTTLGNFLALQVLHSSAARTSLRALQAELYARGEPAAETLRAGLDCLREQDLRAEVSSIHLPTLIVHGDRDAMTPASAAHWLAQHLPGACHVEIQGAAHAPFLSHADTFNRAVLEFLEAR